MAAGPSIPANNPLLQPNTPLQGNSLLQAGQALANAQTAGPLTELARQIAQNNAQGAAAQKLTSGYFNQLGQQVRQGSQQEGQIAGGLNQQLAGIAGNTQAQLRGIGQNAQQSLLKYAPQSDASNSLANPALQSLTQEVARQQGLAAQDQGAFRSFGATQGANYHGLEASNLGTFGLRGQEALKGIAQGTRLQNTPLESKIAALNAQKGALLTTDLGRLRQQEITNRFTSQGLGLKQDSLNATVANDAAKNALTLRGQNVALNGQQLAQMRSDRLYQLDAQKFGAAQAKDSYLRAHGLGPYKTAAGSALPRFTPTGQPTLSPALQQQKFGQVDTIRGLIYAAQRAGHSNQDITASLQNGTYGKGYPRYDPALVQAAFALDGWGYLRPEQITELNKLGLIVGNRYPRGSGKLPAAANIF